MTDSAVICDDMVAVNDATRTMLPSIHATATILPGRLTGALFSHPPVMIVATLHQVASPMPARYDLGKQSGFTRRSRSQRMLEVRRVRPTSVPSMPRMSRERNRDSVDNHVGP